MKKEKKYYGLCFRCEHRAKFLEDGHGPRCECGDVKFQSFSCYMYSPCKLIVLRRRPGDRRYVGLPAAFAPRMMAIGLEEGTPTLSEISQSPRSHKAKKYVIHRRYSDGQKRICGKSEENSR